MKTLLTALAITAAASACHGAAVTATYNYEVTFTDPGDQGPWFWYELGDPGTLIFSYDQGDVSNQQYTFTDPADLGPFAVSSPDLYLPSSLDHIDDYGLRITILDGFISTFALFVDYDDEYLGLDPVGGHRSIGTGGADPGWLRYDLTSLQTTVAPVPLPASGLLLLMTIGASVPFLRRKTAA